MSKTWGASLVTLGVAVTLACGGTESEAPQNTVGDVDSPLLLVSSDRGDGYIDDQGRWVIRPPARGDDVVVADRFAVIQDGQCVVYDRGTGVLSSWEVGPAEACRPASDGVLVLHEQVLSRISPDDVVMATQEVSGQVTLDGDRIAACAQREACGYLDDDLNWTGAGPVYSRTMPFREGPGVAQLVDTGDFVLVDGHGEVLATIAAHMVFGFSERRAVALFNLECDPADPHCASPSTEPALLNADGEVLARFPRTTVTMDSASTDWLMHDGVVRIAGEDTDRLVDRDGTVIRDVTERGWQFSDGLAPVQRDGSWVYVDHDGTVVLGGPYDRAGAVQHGFARIGTDVWVRATGERIQAQPL